MEKIKSIRLLFNKSHLTSKAKSYKKSLFDFKISKKLYSGTTKASESKIKTIMKNIENYLPARRIWNGIIGLSVITGILGFSAKDLIYHYIVQSRQAAKKRLDRVLLLSYHINIKRFLKKPTFWISRQATDKVINLLNQKYDDVQYIFVHGVSGSGKSTLVQDVVKNYYKTLKANQPEEPRIVFVFNADEPTLLEVEYRSFAQQLGIEVEDKDIAYIKEKVEQQLALRPFWMLVFDDVRNPEVIKQFIPHAGEKQSQGKIIITSRENINPKLLELNNEILDLTNIDLNHREYQFTGKECEQFIDNIIGNNKADRQYKLLLARNLGFIPLAIKQAALLLMKNQGSNIDNQIISKFIENFRNLKEVKCELDKLQKKPITSKDVFLSSAEHHAIITNALHAQAIEKLTNEMRTALAKVCLFNIKHVELSFLNQLLGSTNSEAQARIFDELESLGFIDEIGPDVYQVHSSLSSSIIHINAKDKMLNATLDENSYKANLLADNMLFLNKLLSPDNRLVDAQLRHQLLIPHALQLISHFESWRAAQGADKPLKIDYRMIEGIATMYDALANSYTSVINDYRQARRWLAEGLRLLANYSDVKLCNDYPCTFKTYNDVVLLFNSSNANFLKDDFKFDAEHYKNLKDINHEMPALYARLLYSLCRIYFYAKDDNYYHYSKAKEAIQTAVELMKLYNQDNIQQGKVPSFEEVLYRMNGLYYFDLEIDLDYRFFKGKKIATENLKHAIVEYKNILEDSKIYINRGEKLVINKAGNDNLAEAGAYSRMVIHDQLATAYRKLSEQKPIGYGLSRFFKSKNVLAEDWQSYYQNAIENSVGSDEKSNQLEGAITLSQNDEKFHDRKPIYLNTLASTLLSNPCQNDKSKIQNVLNNEKIIIPNINLFTNLELAEQLYLHSKKLCLEQKKSPKFAIANAWYGLAQVYYLQNRYNEAIHAIDECIKLQKQMKRLESHNEFKAAKNFQKNLLQEQKAQVIQLGINL